MTAYHSAGGRALDKRGSPEVLGDQSGRDGCGLGVSPILFLAQFVFLVAFGVLVDPFVVRSLLVRVLAYDIGRWMWWPGSLERRGGARDVALHSPEDDAVEGRDPGPVEVTGQSVWMEHRALPQDRSAGVVRADDELEPSEAG